MSKKIIAEIDVPQLLRELRAAETRESAYLASLLKHAAVVIHAQQKGGS